MRVRAKQSQTASKTSRPFFSRGPKTDHAAKPFFSGSAPIVQAKCKACESSQNAPQSSSGSTIGTKPAVGARDDRFEKEADRVADQVMRMPQPDAAVMPSRPGNDSCPGCQAKHEAAPKGKMLQASGAAGGSTEISAETAGGIRALRGGGQALAPSVRRFFEPRFGQDFRDVRVHTGRAAAGLSRGLHAKAFTVGRDIAFGAGQYSPTTVSGKHLLAHELAHTIQQRGNTAARSVVMRRWDRAASECSGADPDKWLRRVVVEQETPQSVTLHWSDGSIESGQCSTGKGHCCVDSPQGTACTVRGSRVDGSNCTPITERNGYPVKHRDLDHKGIKFWTEFVPARGIALHRYSRVDGTPLSHGCVRLNEATAKTIFCGARQNQTSVQVQGFARPMCSRTSLRNEWLGDFAAGGSDLSAADGDRERASILETRRMLNESFGRELTVSEIQGLQAGDIPVCGHTAALPTAEETALTAVVSEKQRKKGRTSKVGVKSPGPQATVPARILAESGFNRFLVPFTSDLSRAGNLNRARRVVRRRGRELWNAATKRAQASKSPQTDDRPLYWARLQMSRALRQWSPRFTLADADRQDLLERFERASRGMETVTFRAKGAKRILVSGFDPFSVRPFLNRSNRADPRRSNPSGAAVVSLDGQRISNGNIRGEIQGVVFPVRFADFNAGMVENFFRPYISGTTPVNMVMTISQGSTAFEVERFAGRRRSSGSFAGNLGQTGGGTRTSPTEPPGLAAGPEFLKTTLPEQAIRSALGRTTPLPEETEIDEIPAKGGKPRNRPTGGPTSGSTAVEGSGGGFLSNEIFYRTALLRSQADSTLPVGHLHVPILNLPGGNALTSSTFETARQTIIDKVKLILEAALPKI